LCGRLAGSGLEAIFSCFVLLGLIAIRGELVLQLGTLLILAVCVLTTNKALFVSAKL